MPNYTVDNSLLFDGNVPPTSSSPGYVRMFTAKVPETTFVEFQSKGVETTAGAPLSPPAGPSPVLTQCYVPINHALYFSDFGPPPPITTTLPINIGPAPIRQNGPHGMVGSDGNPVTIQTAADGTITVSGKSKEGDVFAATIAIKEDGSTALTNQWTPTVWIFSRASFTKNGGDPVTLTLGFPPSNLMATLYLGRGNVLSSLSVALGKIVPGTAQGDATFTRVVSYYGENFSSQTLNMPASAQTAGMHLASSAAGNGLDSIEYLAPALAYLASQNSLPALGGRTAVECLASINIGNLESQQTFVSATVPLIATGLQNLAPWLMNSSLLSDTAQWLAFLMTQGAGASVLNQAVADTFTNFQQWAKSLPGPGGNWTRWRQMLTPGDGPGQQAVDWLFDHH